MREDGRIGEGCNSQGRLSSGEVNCTYGDGLEAGEKRKISESADRDKISISLLLMEARSFFPSWNPSATRILLAQAGLEREI